MRIIKPFRIYTLMKSSIRHSLLISLCLHFIALIVAFSILVRQQPTEEFVDGLGVEVFPTSKTRKLRPKIRVESVKALPRQQIKKPTRTFSPRIESARPTSLPSRLTQTVNP
ncbi:MAG: hypothetical protein ACE1ZS_05580, partial [Candidatus Poribacteria bacterium]